MTNAMPLFLLAVMSQSTCAWLRYQSSHGISRRGMLLTIKKRKEETKIKGKTNEEEWYGMGSKFRIDAIRF